MRKKNERKSAYKTTQQKQRNGRKTEWCKFESKRRRRRRRTRRGQGQWAKIEFDGGAAGVKISRV